MIEADKTSPPPDPEREKMLKYAQQKFPRITEPFRSFAIDAANQANAIPEEKLWETAYDLDQEAIDNPAGRELLEWEGALSHRWASTNSDMTYDPDEAAMHLKNFRGELARWFAAKKTIHYQDFNLGTDYRQLAEELVKELDEIKE